MLDRISGRPIHLISFWGEQKAGRFNFVEASANRSETEELSDNAARNGGKEA